jgi:hypothetical protein
MRNRGAECLPRNQKVIVRISCGYRGCGRLPAVDTQIRLHATVANREVFIADHYIANSRRIEAWGPMFVELIAIASALADLVCGFEGGAQKTRELPSVYVVVRELTHRIVSAR